MKPYDVYRYHQTLYLHFTTTTYDFFKYKGQYKGIDETKFRQHPSKTTYISLYRKYGDRQRIINFFVANMVSGNVSYFPGVYLSDEAHERYLKWKGGIDSLSYCLQQETRKMKRYLDDSGASYDKLFRPENGQHPLILRYFYGNEISLETLMIYVILFGLAPYWNKHIVEDVLWPNTLIMIKKYRPFVDFDKEKMKKTIRSVLNTNV